MSVCRGVDSSPDEWVAAVTLLTAPTLAQRAGPFIDRVITLAARPRASTGKSR
ncbi:MAG: hypothetical protein ACRD0K_17155 [Egibacteraceae bacterium]